MNGNHVETIRPQRLQNRRDFVCEHRDVAGNLACFKQPVTVMVCPVTFAALSFGSAFAEP
jgi:hypothetical protein